MREEEDTEGRWPTVNLKQDQLEQVISTDFVETQRIDQAMRVVLDRLEGKTTAPPKQVSYAVPLAFTTLAILNVAAALLLDGGLWQVGWSSWGIAVFIVLAVASAGLAVGTLIRARIKVVSRP